MPTLIGCTSVQYCYSYKHPSLFALLCAPWHCAGKAVRQQERGEGRRPEAPSGGTGRDAPTQAGGGEAEGRVRRPARPAGKSLEYLVPLYCHPSQTSSTYQAAEHDEVQGSEGSEGSNEVQTKPCHPTNQHDNAIILMTSATATYQLANIGCVPYRQPSGMRRRGQP